MSERINKVILVLDRNYGAELSSVPLDGHIWLIESPANREAAASYRAAHGASTAENSVTTFKAGDDDTSSETCLKMLETIDLHHGVYSADPPYAVFEIVGAPLKRSVQSAIEALGFNRFESTDNGFRALR